MNEISILDRYRGAMVGTLCGDAIGAPYEWTWTPETITEDILKRGGKIPEEYELFDYMSPWVRERGVMIEKGQPTDDSELAAALAESLIANPEFQPKDLYERLRSYIVDRKSILTKRAIGSGGTLRAALTPETYEESVAMFERGEIPTPPSNGSIMRCIAVPLRYRNSLDAAAEFAELQSQVTHRNPYARAACVAFTEYVINILDGDCTLSQAWEMTQGVLSLGLYRKDPALQEILAMPIAKPIYGRDILGKEHGVEQENKGWVVLSLRAALWASIESTSFADGILKAVSLAGDTDTYAAIAGGILGAYYGLSGIPGSWTFVLQGEYKMIEFADDLYALAHCTS
jgi:ADP-ribosyl-[dinitrogen reductase] hydrolase